MEDYKEEIKRLLLAYYSAVSTGGLVHYKTTSEILMMFQGIIPSEPITEHDIYEVLKELGFKIEQVSHCMEVEKGRKFCWVLWERVAPGVELKIVD